MKTSVVVLADSVCNEGRRLTTLQVCFPRIILAEVNTHRVLSRNYRSSRAVPVAKLIEEVRANPFVPALFLRNKPGMQGGSALSGGLQDQAHKTWLSAAAQAADNAEHMAMIGVHKQFANRILEPYAYVHGVISATDWDNLFALRCHPDAQPEFQELAVMMRDAIAASTPVLRDGRLVEPASWHMPYVSDEERACYDLGTCLQLSAARCAWVSYKPFEPAPDGCIDRELATFAKLADSTPIHASPLEHQAAPSSFPAPGNFPMWAQFRHLYEAMGRKLFENLGRGMAA